MRALLPISNVPTIGFSANPPNTPQVSSALLPAGAEPSLTYSPEVPWRPRIGASWQWQLEGRLDLSVDVDVYDIDLFDASAADVGALHAKGRRVLCYVSVGTWEPWRPDAARFPRMVKGRSVEGWTDERWLDIRRVDVLKPIMAARLDLCKAKGFDGVEADNVDGYSNATGFQLHPSDQLLYNRWLASAAHSRGLSIALKNDIEQIPELVDDFDFAINEECFNHRECAALTLFIERGKAVFHVEYDSSTRQFCSEVRRLQFSSMRKHRELDSFREPC